MSYIRLLQYFVIVNAAVLIVQTARVIAVYSAVYSLTPKNVRRQLPLHVWLIATSYLIYVCGTTYLLIVNGSTFAALARTVFYGLAGAIGQYALWNVLVYERRRYSLATSYTDQGDAE